MGVLYWYRNERYAAGNFGTTLTAIIVSLRFGRALPTGKMRLRRAQAGRRGERQSPAAPVAQQAEVPDHDDPFNAACGSLML
ncbi:hypothetical protein PG997_009672 [Apiospora hydei]|uniref:Uncharacterized protein n=1 Tax=Apiospora hydei TaxID=1337664 RepID=A0ABR1VUT7_9PEZI